MTELPTGHEGPDLCMLDPAERLQGGWFGDRVVDTYDDPLPNGPPVLCRCDRCEEVIDTAQRDVGERRPNLRASQRRVC